MCVYTEMMRQCNDQQQQQQHAADNTALMQIYQRYQHDPMMLQRQINAFVSMTASKAHENEVAARMMEASQLVYHFASMSPINLS